MKKEKWILLGVLFVIPILLQKLFSNLGIQISSEASLWLFLSAIALFVTGIAIPKEYQKWTKWFIIILFLLFVSSCVGGCCKKKPPPVPPPPAPTAQKTWQQDVEIPGKDPEGQALRVQGPGYYDVTYLSGDIYDTATDEYPYSIWGSGYDREWKEYFPYADIPGVQALEALLITDGEVGGNNGNVCQFPDNQKTVRVWISQYVRFFRHEAFRPDINGNKYWCFQNNSGTWKFRISRVN